jgi:hypothetical protein
VRLSSVQQTTFKTWLTANAAALADQAAADLANAAAAPSYFVWNPSCDPGKIEGGIDKSLYTPTDTPPASGTTVQLTNDALLFQNRALACQLKQFNAQWLLTPRGVINASLTQVRKNFQDCLRQIPSGVAGAVSDAGWGAPGVPGVARLAMMNLASNFEKLYTVVATGIANDGVTRGANTSPDNYGADADGNLLYGALVTAQNVAETRAS